MPAFVPRNIDLETLCPMLLSGIKASKQWKSESECRTLLTESVQIYLPRSVGEDAHIVMRMENKVAWTMLHKVGIVESARKASSR